MRSKRRLLVLDLGKPGWASLIQTRRWPRARRVLVAAARCVGILFLTLTLTLLLCALRSNLFSSNCRGKPPILRPQNSTHAVFTAKVLFAGRSIDAMMDRGIEFGPWSWGQRNGDWAIGIVQEQFWGMPHWTRLVLLINYVYWQGETYFVDGQRSEGWLTHFLPIVEGGVGCSRTQPIQFSLVDLRLLRKPPPEGRGRAMGYVLAPEIYTSPFERPPKPTFVAGAQITVTGPAASRKVTTDSEGVYELEDLPPGDYALRLSMLETQSEGCLNRDGSPARIHLGDDGVVERNLHVFWEGRIEGAVKSDSGSPAHAWVQLLSADERRVSGCIDWFQITAKDGSYRFQQVPPGRYRIVLNPNGPFDEWPHDLQYFPSGVHESAARVFELAPGQQVKGIDFRPPLLPPRTTQVRVTWPNGEVAADAGICVAYENTRDYDSLSGPLYYKTTDQHGIAQLATYGSSQVRVFAKHSGTSGRFQSQSLQFAADRTPASIDLVLASAK